MKSILFAVPVMLALATPSSAGSTQSNAAHFLSNYQTAVTYARNGWPGFRPNTIPKLILDRNNAGVVTSIIAFDHPNPSAFGNAQPMRLGDGTTGRAFLITNPTSNATLNEIENFEFSANLGGAPTFVIASQCADIEQDNCLSGPEFTAYTLHEMFHRYQDEAFKQPRWADQSTYYYSKDFIRLTLLENQLFTQAKSDISASQATALAQKLIALRDARHKLSDLTALDEQQERFEGTARYIEHLVADSIGAGYGSDAYTSDLKHGVSVGQVKDELSFGRFYATGAIGMLLGERIGIDTMKAKIEAGQSPLEVLADHFVLSSEARQNLLNQVVAEFDANGSVSAKAEELAASAKSEPDIWN